LLGMHALPEDVRAEFYPQVRHSLIERGVITAADVPEQYDGAWFQSALNYGQQPQKVGTREVVITNPDGSRTTHIVKDEAGQTFESAAPAKEGPKPGSEEDFIQRFARDLGVPVEQLKPSQIESARRRYAQMTRFVEPKAATDADQEWVVRNGVVTPIAKGTAQAGDRPYDAVAARQANAIDPVESESVTRTALGLVDRLASHPGIDRATGAYEVRGFTQDAVDFNSIRDQLVAALALPNLGALKGPMSDKDILFVKQLATRLENRRLSKAETIKAIEEARTFLNGKLSGATAPAPSAVQAATPARAGGPGPAGPAAPRAMADPLGIR
jgi:hypothetical protein